MARLDRLITLGGTMEKGTEMTIETLNRRLSRLSDAASPRANFALSLAMAIERQKARQAEWNAAGNTGSVPREPLEPPLPATARRYDKELWRKIAHGEARLLFLPDRTDELQAAYAMSDEDLWRTVSQRAR
jgi:hypothetical protein